MVTINIPPFAGKEIFWLYLRRVILKENTKSTIGKLSILTVIINIVFFFIIRGPNASLTLLISVFTVLSTLGIIFAVISKKWSFIIAGIVLNGAVLIIAYFLLLATGISEP